MILGVSDGIADQKSMMDKSFDFAAAEGRASVLWEETGAFRAGRADRVEAQPFCVVIPPPNVTGNLHMGHALNNTLQDILCRYWRMNGRDVRARDVQILFADAATGARSPALVHQGKIGEIIQAKPEQRRRVLEDAAESLGSTVRGRHTGTFGLMGTFSFNGNKTVTTGGGGAIVTNDQALARRAKHITTTAKLPHRWEFRHDEVGYNFRMPNLNAALGCAQLEQLPVFLEEKRRLFERYSFDLIYARPGQTAAGWRAELARAITEAAEHLSLYQLTIEPDTPFATLHAAGKLAVPDAEASGALKIEGDPSRLSALFAMFEQPAGLMFDILTPGEGRP